MDREGEDVTTPAPATGPGDLGLVQLGRNVGFTLTRQVAVAGIGLALIVLLARLLGPEGNGAFNLAVFLPLMLSLGLNLGVPAANSYFIGRGTIDVRTALSLNLRLWGILSAGGLVVGGVVLAGWSSRLFPGVPSNLLWLALLITPLVLLQSFLSGLLQGAQDFRRFNLVSLTAPAVSLALAVVVVWWGNGGVVGALACFGIGLLAAIGVAGFAVRSHLASGNRGRARRGEDGPPDAGRRRGAVTYGRFIGYGGKAHVANVLALLNYRVDLLLVNLLLSPAATGVYVIAVQISERLWMLSQAVSTVLLPRLAELHRDEALRRMVTPVVSRWVFVMTLAGAVLLALVARPAVGVFFGDAYREAARALLWLLPGVVLLSPARVLANDLAARGRPDLSVVTEAVVISINVVGNLVLIPRFGIEGAAMATSLAYTVGFVIRLHHSAQLSGNPRLAPVSFGRRDIGMLRRVLRELRASRAR